jgi:hypothetical protein
MELLFEVEMKYDKSIPTPCKQQVERYLKRWNSLPENYITQEKVLNMLFSGAFRLNNDIQNILVKCCTLNDFYSTKIYKIYPVAKQILDLNIDKALNEGDLSLVERISNIDMLDKNGALTHYCFYSFATKYCSQHNPEAYPMFDSYIETILKHFRKNDNRFWFRNEDLKNYPSFKKIIIDFQTLYDLTEFCLKDMDRYLWQLGKEYYPNNYNTGGKKGHKKGVKKKVV